MEVPDSPSNRPRLASFDQRLADFDTFSPGSAPPEKGVGVVVGYSKGIFTFAKDL